MSTPSSALTPTKPLTILPIKSSLQMTISCPKYLVSGQLRALLDAGRLTSNGTGQTRIGLSVFDCSVLMSKRTEEAVGAKWKRTKDRVGQGQR